MQPGPAPLQRRLYRRQALANGKGLKALLPQTEAIKTAVKPVPVCPAGIQPAKPILRKIEVNLFDAGKAEHAKAGPEKPPVGKTRRRRPDNTKKTLVRERSKRIIRLCGIDVVIYEAEHIRLAGLDDVLPHPVQGQGVRTAWRRHRILRQPYIRDVPAGRQRGNV